MRINTKLISFLREWLCYNNSMNEASSKIFAFLFLVGTPSSKDTILKACDLNKEELKGVISLLKESLKTLPFTLIESETEVQLVLTEQMTSYFDPFIKKAREETLTAATLQTLTIIGYLGMASKYEISFVRGVSSTQSISTLLSKSLIEEVEQDRYSLSVEALSHLGIIKKEDLPDFEKTHEEFIQKIKNASSI